MSPPVLFITTLLVIIVAVVVMTIITKPRPERLSRTEKRELQKLRDLVDHLAVKAAEHAVLGDHFAAITLDSITKTRKEIR